MNTLGAFWLSASIAVGVAVLTMLMLRRSLDSLLAEVCGSAGRARFWSIFSSVSIVLTALLGMMVSFPLSKGGGWSDHSLLPIVLSAFRTSLVFLLLALGSLGFVLLLGIGDYERRRRQEDWKNASPPPARSAG